MRSLIYKLLLASLLITASHATLATIDDNAAQVALRVSCTENGTTMDNCFESIPALTSWMSVIRKPSASAPLDVQVGPGTFGRLPVTCNPANGYTGHIAFNGAGPRQTVFSFTAGGQPPYGIVEVRNCTKMAFSNLKIEAKPIVFAYGYIVWHGGGTSHWNNVVAEVSARGWQEQDCAATPGSHYWFNSRIISRPVSNIGKTYEATCDNTWFFGSEIVFNTDRPGTIGSDGGVNGTTYQTLIANNDREIHVYGSNIRALSENGGVNGTGTLIAATANSGSQIHIHGTGIDLITNDNKNIVALSATSGGMIHANESAYVMKTAGGTATRISNNGGSIQAPYLWQEGATPPNVTSANGSDMAVITSTSDGQPHLTISSTSCASGWYDTAANQCVP